MNSRGTATGAIDLILTGTRPAFKTRRISLPEFVSSVLRDIYKRAGLKWGCSDLVIWNAASHEVRLVEVKCPHCDKPSRIGREVAPDGSKSRVCRKCNEVID